MSDQVKALAPVIWSEIQKADKILLSLHNGVDLDSIGSNLALKTILEKEGKTVTLISGDDQINIEALRLPEAKSISLRSLSQTDLQNFDLFIALDIPTPYKLSSNPIPKFPLSVKTVNIDHHFADNAQFGDVNLVVPESSSAEVVLELAQAWGIKLDPHTATNLLAGLYSDTGSLVYPNTTAGSYIHAAKLIEYGASPLLVNHILEGLTNSQLKVVGLGLYKVVEYFSGKVLITDISRAEIKNLGIQFQTTRSIHKQIYYLKLSTQALIEVAIYDKPNGTVGISFRADNSNDLRDVSLLAKALGGGGHPQSSSAADFTGTHKNALQSVLDVIQRTYPDLGQP